MSGDPSHVTRAAAALAEATALVVTAGAGMGVDSGLPDFRGNEGFWRAYPPYAKLGLSFADLANPRWFRNDPRFAWGFYGHRKNLYGRTGPHAGFAVLLAWARAMKDGYFVFTSNVDGHFQAAGFDPLRVHECHGAIEFMQCTAECGVGIFPAGSAEVPLDDEGVRARDPLPACPRCCALARPNILMFGDGGWDDTRSRAQEMRLHDWLDGLHAKAEARVVVVECGAGTAIPTVRGFGEDVAAATKGTLVRINVREPRVPDGQIGLAMGALAALRAIDEALASRTGQNGA
jgi:NAD-dependent SIR2 family protein deacetylase